jgi:hypothetical protein
LHFLPRNRARCKLTIVCCVFRIHRNGNKHDAHVDPIWTDNARDTVRNAANSICTRGFPCSLWGYFQLMDYLFTIEQNLFLRINSVMDHFTLNEQFDIYF